MSAMQRLLTLLVLIFPAIAGAEAAFSRVDTDEDGRARALQLGIVTYVGQGASVS